MLRKEYGLWWKEVYGTLEGIENCDPYDIQKSLPPLKCEVGWDTKRKSKLHERSAEIEIKREATISKTEKRMARRSIKRCGNWLTPGREQRDIDAGSLDSGRLEAKDHLRFVEPQQ